MPDNFGGKNVLEVLPHPDAYLERWEEYKQLSEKAKGLEIQIEKLLEGIDVYRETDEEKYNNVLATLSGFEKSFSELNIRKQLAYNSFSLAVRAATKVRALNKADRDFNIKAE
jgi:hypothetical protein